ncbi:hypothetical protein BHAOGJBA_6178 [Methylobacterium hispanicum]|uniref:CopG family transcriptional regulator n=1 Tax=Methylobacterium hispanicum TaxID=270350 RepID=A0AAV4ZWX6_9HYPH|nr:hypothetical protein BHAOGJBA_6178 [Methylobacterium hispanicum]
MGFSSPSQHYIVIHMVRPLVPGAALAQRPRRSELLSFRLTKDEDVRLRQMAAAGIGPTEVARYAVLSLLAGRRISAYRRGRDAMTRTLAELHVATIGLSEAVQARPDLDAAGLRPAIDALVAAALRVGERADREGGP